MLKIGIVGAGTMGSLIARAVDRGDVGARLVAITDLDRTRAEDLIASLSEMPALENLTELIDTADVVVEAAGIDAVRRMLPAVVERGKQIVVLSVGGLIDMEDWIRRAAGTGAVIRCPSGAIAGLDAVKSLAIGRVESAAIVTRKPPEGLRGAPYLVERGIDLENLREPLVVFEGSAREACRAFPANINVAAALSLAGIGVDRTRVRIIADPHVDLNTHRVEIRGDAGSVTTTTRNVPSENPRTSRLAALSAIALLSGMTGSLRIGT
jgi:aspartate dehydrogenase